MRLVIAFLYLAVAVRAQSPIAVREVPITGVIQPVTTEVLAGAITQASASHDTLLILRIDTPGGLLTSMRDCVAKILASPVPVVAFVAPGGARAASAGFFLLEAADVAAMAPGSNTGAAHPVISGATLDPVMKEKLENDASASLRSVTSQRGRNVALAESAVRQSRSFTAREALDGNLIEFIAPDERALLRQLDGHSIRRFDGASVVLHTAGAVISPYRFSVRQRILSTVGDPNVALVLLALGVLGIYVEFMFPGLIVPGVVGAILAILGLASISALPLHWPGVALMLLALGLFALEFKFVSHGVLAVSGAFALVFGITLLIDSPIPEMRICLATALAVALPLAAISFALVRLAVRARRAKVVTGRQGMIGLWGVALDDLAPEGRVFVHGENWLAHSASPVSRGARVHVNGVSGLVLNVDSTPKGIS